MNQEKMNQEILDFLKKNNISLPTSVQDPNNIGQDYINEVVVQFLNSQKYIVDTIQALSRAMDVIWLHLNSIARLFIEKKLATEEELTARYQTDVIEVMKEVDKKMMEMAREKMESEKEVEPVEELKDSEENTETEDSEENNDNVILASERFKND